MCFSCWFPLALSTEKGVPQKRHTHFKALGPAPATDARDQLIATRDIAVDALVGRLSLRSQLSHTKQLQWTVLVDGPTCKPVG